ncbi:hypothetical protein [Campylobacter fetus]|uniref:hypothetical protein n=1 Tax=Campylobacter fetus TaxID=196 RepID=UPI00042A22AB|nr:hypothetical protein [Campylobacter fetus]AGZ82561.2 hypothetical protein CFT03427_1728 [Campylobacter fetus subsp. testudinum 03-427]ALV65729.2 hypothetical protein CFTSP3_1793 [Campylobacter fetus subsp. testudinum Sp3]UEA65420.1 hypothetical protein LK457_01505 [Campylobacter fetus subsp. testudinum]
MRYVFMTLIITAFLGCSSTWHGIKEDSNSAYQWSKKKVNQSADWVEEKTSD